MAARRREPSWIARTGRAHVRLWISIAIGFATYALLAVSGPSPSTITQALVGWDVGVVCYLIAVAMLIARATVAQIRHHAASQDEGAFAILLLVVAAVLASVGAIYADLAAADRNDPSYPIYIALAVVTVVLSWAFLHTIFALHYAHAFYGTHDHANGLEFPGETRPDYWDFVYFSFVIGMTFQVSDVAVTNKRIRRMVVTHGALSFFFSTAIVALTVNIAANVLQR